MGRVAAERASGVKLFCQNRQMRNHYQSIPDRLQPRLPMTPQVSHSRAPVEIMLLLNVVKIRAEREEKSE